MNLVRKQLKQFYKIKRKEDRVVGCRVNDIMQSLHHQYKLLKESRDPEKIGMLLAEITEIRETNRFRDDFPSLSSFKKYLKKEKLTLKELEDL